MNTIVYEKLKEVAKKDGVITYSQLVSECNLGLDLEQIKDRNELSSILGDISKFEVENNRPMLSVVVVLKNTRPMSPSYGFYNYADELNIRKKGESNDLLFERQRRECFEYWKTK